MIFCISVIGILVKNHVGAPLIKHTITLFLSSQWKEVHAKTLCLSATWGTFYNSHVQTAFLCDVMRSCEN